MALVLLALVALGLDLARPPATQASTRLLLAAIDLYQWTLSERVGLRCRFRPTCSRYGEMVIRREGALVGGFKAGWRILRCGPWTPAGTFDPPSGWQEAGRRAQRKPPAGVAARATQPSGASAAWTPEQRA